MIRNQRLSWCMVMVLVVVAGTGWAECPEADLTGDCVVNISDFSMMASEWLSAGLAPGEPPYPKQATVEGESYLYARITGQSQGAIHGSCTELGREQTIVCVNYDHQVQIPTDPLTGLATGQRRHKALSIVKYTDRASPRLLQALCTGESLVSVELEYYRLNLAENPVLYYTIDLESAHIIDYEAMGPNLERFTFAYATITWTWMPDGIGYEDDWAQPQS